MIQRVFTPEYLVTQNEYRHYFLNVRGEELVCSKRGKLHLFKAIVCDPSDYIRAWLGPVGERFPHTERASMQMGRLVMESPEYRSKSQQYEHVAMHCPAAIASAMGSSVWKRTETGWEVVG